MKGRGKIGVDLHKEERTEVPEMGGLSILFTLLVVLIFNYLLGLDELLFPILAIYLIGTLGIIDDIMTLSANQKIFSFTVVGSFLAWGLGYKASGEYLLLGGIFMASVNFTNMLAGFNGLEIGTGAIASLGLAALSYLRGVESSLTISLATAGALLAFLYYNRFPAAVFPGDVGTLIIGAALFSSILLGDLFIPGTIIFIPYLADAALKFFSAGIMVRQSQLPTTVKDGKLYVPEGSNLSLARMFLMKDPLTEKQVVARVWIVEIFFTALAIGLEVMT